MSVSTLRSIVCLCLTTLAEGFPCFFLSCKAKARVKSANTGQGPHSNFCVVLCIFVLLYVLFVLCLSLYCLCVYRCTELLPPGGYPIAVKHIISLLIKRSNLMQQYADIYLRQRHSTCFGRHSTHHQEY